MKQYIFNHCGVCTNPDQVWRWDAKDCFIEIKAAPTENGYGVTLSYQVLDHYNGSLPSKSFNFSTLNEGILNRVDTLIKNLKEKIINPYTEKNKKAGYKKALQAVKAYRATINQLTLF